MNSDSYKNITARLKTVSRRYILTGIAEAFWAACAVGIWLTMLFTICESIQYLSPPVKKILFFTVLAVTVSAFCTFFLFRLLRCPGTDEIARMVEQTFPHLGDRLISAVQLGRLDDSALKGQSQNLVDALVQRVEEKTRTVDMARAVPTQRLVAWIRITIGTVIASLVLSLLFPGHMLGGLFRFVDYSHAYIRPGDIMIYTLSRDGSIIRGENFSTKGFVSGGSARTLNVLYRWDDSDVRSVKPVDFDEKTGAFTMTIEKPRSSFHYILEMGSYSTPRRRITVIERPVVEELALTVTYPAYTGLGTVTRSDNNGNIRAPAGSEVVLAVSVNKPINSMKLHWGDSTVTDCDIEGLTGRAFFTVTSDNDYHIGLVDTLGIANSNPISYRVTCFKDENPAVTILSPASDIILPRIMRFPIVFRARDDFGITSITLSFQLPFEKTPHELPLKNDLSEKDILEEYEWNLSRLDLLPDDSITYYLTVYDNDMVGGPKKGVSETRTVRVPSLIDLLSKTTAEQENGIAKLREMARRTAQQNKKLDDVRRNIKSGREPDWSEKNVLDEAAKNFENMQKELKALSEEIEKAAERLSDEDIAAFETLEKMNKISQMMNELADGYMKDALKRLSQAAAELDPEKINKALEKYEITAEAVKERLDRFINLLEQVMSIQRFQMAKKILEEISFKQAEITEQFNQEHDNSNLAREQETLASDMNTLQEELLNVSDDLKERFSLDTRPLESKIRSGNVSENMRKTARQIADNKNAEAGQGLEQSNMMLSELLETMNALDAAMRDRNTAEMKKRLFKAAVELLAVSRKQEQLLDKIGAAGKEDMAKLELEVIDGLQKARQSLAEFSSVFVEVSSALDILMEYAQMTAGIALDSFATGNSVTGKQEALNTISTVNKTVHFLSMLLQNSPADGQGMPGDLMSQLQQIASGELSLHMQMNPGMSEEMLAKLAAEQQKLAEMLSELSKKIAADKQLQEMLEKIVEEMDDTANMMRMNKDREIIERSQLDMYRRLLDARRSRREKNEERERKSWTAKRDFSIGADVLAEDRGEKKRELNERIKRAMQDDFNPEFKRLILRYFESMLKDNVEVIGR